jgi:2-keto-4-pentenoate hydratase/2-oxohepta-3-ene-1,7-dioic acid hydratase in catechol pathway
MQILRVEQRGVTSFATPIDDNSLRLLSGAPWLSGTETSVVIPRREARLLAPVTPSKILCVGRNYAAHAKELGNDVPSEPLLFLKPPSAVCGPEDEVRLPAMSQRVEHEAELGVVIGKRLKDASPTEVRQALFGFTCVNDITARDLQKKDGQFTRAKGFDGFCPVGPCIVTDLDDSALDVSCRVNGQTRQHGNTRDMVFAVADLIAFMSRVMTLEPGDLISTGTPEGVGPLLAGDRVEVEVQGIGVLSNPIASA